MKRIVIINFVILVSFGCYSQKVGIGTNNPLALLHVADSNVVFSGPDTIANFTTTEPPIQGPGSRLMWYAAKAAFRAGYVDSTQWEKDSIGRYSIATGLGSKAIGEISTAMGRRTRASGVDATAMGAWSVASNTATTAMGEMTIASGYAATAMGALNTASGVSSTAMGEFTTASGHYSVSMGLSTTASGEHSISMGANNNASGFGSLATGFLTTASGPNSTALGRETTASGYYSTAMGNGTLASQSYSTAMGWMSKATGEASTGLGFSTISSGIASTSMGYSTNASGNYSIATGMYSKAPGFTSFASGFNTQAIGDYSTTMGYGTYAPGSASTAVGFYTKARSHYSFVIGHYNDTTSTGRIFEVGNGTSDSDRKNALTVMANGNIGIGIIPSRKLEILVGNSGSTYHFQTSVGIENNNSHYLSLLTNNTSETGLLFGNSNSGSAGGITYRATNVADPEAMYFRTANSTRMAIYNNGNAWLQGTLTQNSDARLKTNITLLNGTLSLISQLNGYTYNWKNPSLDQGQQIGLLAQEVQQVLPQLVKKNANGELSINYNGLIPILLEGMKEQQKQIDELNNIVNKLLEK